MKGNKRKGGDTGTFHIRLGANIEVHPINNIENRSKRPCIPKNPLARIRNKISLEHGRRGLLEKHRKNFKIKTPRQLLDSGKPAYGRPAYGYNNSYYSDAVFQQYEDWGKSDSVELDAEDTRFEENGREERE